MTAEERRTISSRKQVINDDSSENKTIQARLSGNDNDDTLEIKETYIKDADGNVERHDVTVSERFCDHNAGDYLPGDKSCDSPCPLRGICATNAVNFGRIQLDDDFEERMRSEAAIKFGTDNDDLSSLVVKKRKNKNRRIKK